MEKNNSSIRETIKRIFSRENICDLFELLVITLKIFTRFINKVRDIILCFLAILLCFWLISIRVQGKEEEKTYYVCSSVLLSRLRNTFEFIEIFNIPICFLLIFPPLNPLLIEMPIKYIDCSSKEFKHIASIKEDILVLLYFRNNSINLIIRIIFLMDIGLNIFGFITNILKFKNKSKFTKLKNEHIGIVICDVYIKEKKPAICYIIRKLYIVFHRRKA